VQNILLLFAFLSWSRRQLYLNANKRLLMVQTASTLNLHIQLTPCPRN